jgi:hypothetical protein
LRGEPLFGPSNERREDSRDNSRVVIEAPCCFIRQRSNKN